MKRTQKPMRKTINLVGVFSVERIGPNYSDFHFKLKFYGESR